MNNNHVDDNLHFENNPETYTPDIHSNSIIDFGYQAGYPDGD